MSDLSLIGMAVAGAGLLGVFIDLVRGKTKIHAVWVVMVVVGLALFYFD